MPTEGRDEGVIRICPAFPTVEDMTNNTPLRELHWPLIAGLGALALIRPVARIVEEQLGLSAGSVLPIALTIVVTVAWVVIVGFSRVRQPLLTLVFSGVAYAVFSTVLSAILSPILTGELQGPIAMPIAIIPVLLINAGWGLAAGALALAVQHLRGVRRRSTAPR
jgi:hypothetical protein